MKMKSFLASALAVSCLIAFAPGCATSQARLLAQAKVSRADAEKTALAKAPGGTVKEGELEKEKGRLIWSFDITTPGTQDITEVHVDALTGEVVAVETESAAEEGKGKKASKAKKKSTPETKGKKKTE